MSPHLIFLFLAPPALALLYAVLEYLKVLDRWTGRNHAIEGSAPFGGVKNSGIGVEFNVVGPKEYITIQVLNVAK
jgi:acyl-CoA reductase-like NAD-dependent aldehyde dehydrogenase